MRPTEQLPQGLHIPLQEESGLLHMGDRPVQVGEQLPAVMHVADMCRAFRIKSSTFYVRLKRGLYDAFELLPRVGRRRWDGAAVSRHLRVRESRTFGRRS